MEIGGIRDTGGMKNNSVVFMNKFVDMVSFMLILQGE